MITILCILSKRDQNKTDLQSEKTKELNARWQAMPQRLEDSLNRNKEPSEESNLDPTITTEVIVPDSKKTQKVVELEWQPIEIFWVKNPASV